MLDRIRSRDAVRTPGRATTAGAELSRWMFSAGMRAVSLRYALIRSTALSNAGIAPSPAMTTAFSVTDPSAVAS